MNGYNLGFLYNPGWMEKNQVTKLKEVTKKQGVKAVVFDIDRTVADSGPLWQDAFGLIGEKVATSTGVDAGSVIEEVLRLNSELYKTAGHHPRKYAEIGRRLVHKYGIKDEEMKEWMKEAMRIIYCRPPELYPETEEVLETVTAANLLVAFATHSPAGRARILKSAYGWGERYPICTQSLFTDKDERVWKQAADSLEVSPVQILAVGDNFKGDIKSAEKAGIRHIVWVNAKRKQQNETDNEEIPEGVIKIDGIGQLVSAVIEKFFKE